MTSVPRYVPRYKVEDYRLWPGDWELIDGVAISMSPSPVGPHERVVSRLSYAIRNQLMGQSCPCEVYTNLDWILSNDSVIRPDLMVVCGDQPEKHLERPPVLVVEVLSPKTRVRDLSVKRALYSESGVPHYLVFDPDDRTGRYIGPQDESSFEGQTKLEVVLELGPNCMIEIASEPLFD